MNLIAVTFDADSPIRTVTFKGELIKYPDASCEHSHALVLSAAGNQVGSFDVERAVAVQVTPVDG